ncbi:Afadin and alpha-actinin-binding-domain-containing protein [Daedaleopsis nitida]|nr:Afadin and alpha-actinin-binding-domain-containing protein [Daedaleopsis nitida]
MSLATPKRLVHCALDASLSELASPFSEAGSSDSCTSTSSLPYINAQLSAHGFVHDGGLSLDGLAKGDADRVVKCILSMLSQRIDDMSRTEELTTKLRTLSYDHERLTSMFKTEAEKAANAEREMNLHKTRMTAATKSLQSCENAHKHTTSELQRTRSTLHGLRAAHQTEIKKLEKEKDRMVERWTRLSDSQLKTSSLHSGLTCANLSVVEASDVQLRGKGQGFLDVSLEQAETARKELLEQNRKLRGLLLTAANELQSVLHAARTAGGTNYVEEPAPIASSTLFSNAPTETAGETFTSLFTSLRETISSRMDAVSTTTSGSLHSTLSSSRETKTQDNREIERLQAVIDKLRQELDQAQKQAAASAAHIQELFDRFAEEQRITAADVSIDLMTAPARDEEQRRLDERFKELEEERRKFTEAAVRLGRDKAALEAGRLKLLEEKRSWEVQMMLAELPPTPAPAASAVPAGMLPPPTSPRRSPRKFKAKVASPRKTRVSRRSSGLGTLSPRSKSKVRPAYETEVIPSSVSGIPPSPSRQMPEFKTSMEAPAPPSPVFLSSAFVLPPPSPAASLQARDGVATALPPIPPLPKLEIPTPSEENSEDDMMDITPEPGPSSAHHEPGPPVPTTPVVRPFPMAKPFAQRMMHAYSPVKPSPLSRILMMADSPESPDGPKLDALAEVDENSMDTSHIPACAQGRPRSLAEELGVSEDDDDSPLREKQATPAGRSHAATAPAGRKAGSVQPRAGIGAGKTKGKEKEKVLTSGPAAQAAPVQNASRARPGGSLEKENVKRVKLSGPSQPSGGSGGSAKSVRSATSSSSSSSSRDGKKTKPVGIGARARTAASGRGAGAGAGSKPALKGGPRRVPMGSAEAAPVPTWRG